MASKPMKSLKLPGLSDTYTFVQADSTLSQSGEAADAKVTGDAIADIWQEIEGGTARTSNGFGGDIAPVYIGDYLEKSPMQPACCLKIGDEFHCFTGVSVVSEGGDDGYVRVFDTVNNVEDTTQRQTIEVGHANSCATDGEYIYIAPVFTYTGEERESVHYIYRYSLDYTESEKINTPTETVGGTEAQSVAMGVSYDPVSETLYLLTYQRNVFKRVSDGWELCTYINFGGIHENDFQAREYNQDFAVYGGRFFISSPYGNIVSGKISGAVSYVTGGTTLGAIDSTGRFYLGELEGMEFDAAGHLYAVDYNGLTGSTRNAFVIEIPIGITQANSTNLYGPITAYNQTELTLSEASQAAFALGVTEIRSLQQLQARMLRYNTSLVNIPADNDVVEDDAVEIGDNLKINIAGTYSVPNLYVRSGHLSIGTATADDGQTPRLLFTGTTIPMRVYRSGEIAFTGSNRLRISAVREGNQLIELMGDCTRITTQASPINHATGNQWTTGGTRNIRNNSMYVGTVLVYAEGLSMSSSNTYTTNSYVASANFMNGVAPIMMNQYFAIVNLNVVTASALPADTAVEIGKVYAVPVYDAYATLVGDGGSTLIVSISHVSGVASGVVKITSPTGTNAGERFRGVTMLPTYQL